jgi:hypothetical protein
LLRIVSGGQTGVDRGALDAALDLGAECGGWCPAGRLAEDGTIPQRYPVIELTDGGYSERTARNVAHSDGTLIISNGAPTGGTRETVERCAEMRKPYLIVDCKIVPIDQATDLGVRFVSDLSFQSNVKDADVTLKHSQRDLTVPARPGESSTGLVFSLGMTTLNVAGPRASQWPEGHALTYQIMLTILRRISGQQDVD